MTPIEAAKAIAGGDEPIEDAQYPGGRRYYAFCGGLTEDGHEADCSWPSMPKIVAALEAADAFLKALPEWRGKPELRDHDDVTGFGYCPICQESDGHLDTCEYQAFVAALKGPDIA